MTSFQSISYDLSKCHPWNPASRKWKPPEIQPILDQKTDKMRRNLQKAHDQAVETHPRPSVFSLKSPITASELYLDPSQLPPPSSNITLNCSEACARSLRPYMEDAHLILKGPKGTLLGVFDGHSNDGHSGSALALHAAKYCKNHFLQRLDDHHGDVHATFEQILHEIHCQTKDSLGLHAGSTVALCYVTDEGLAYTATLGDSEFMVYRQGQLIPLSCVRDFGSDKDAARAAEALGVTIEEFRGNPPPKISKTLRFPPLTGVNVSRVLGDEAINRYCRCYTGYISHQASEKGKTYLEMVKSYPELADPRLVNLRPLIHKPKITLCPLQPGDIILGACDGLYDFSSDDVIAHVIQTHSPDLSIAEALCNAALESHNALRFGDNITVVAATVEAVSE